MSSARILTACYVLVGLAATYNRGVAISYFLGLILASVVRWRMRRRLEGGVTIATTVAVVFCFLPMGPGPVEIFLLTAISGLIWGNQHRTMKPSQRTASPSTDER